jgi:hypothetical protein
MAVTHGSGGPLGGFGRVVAAAVFAVVGVLFFVGGGFVSTVEVSRIGALFTATTMAPLAGNRSNDSDDFHPPAEPQPPLQHAPTTSETERWNGSTAVHTSGGFAEFYFQTAAHPSCAALALLQKHQHAEVSAIARGAQLQPELETPQMMAKYAERYVCWKHAGMYNPGYDRTIREPVLPALTARIVAKPTATPDGLESAWPLEAYVAASKHATATLRLPGAPAAAHILFRNVVLHGGRLHWCGASGPGPVSFPLAGALSMVKGVWPQVVAEKSPDLHPVPDAWRAALCDAASSNGSSHLSLLPPGFAPVRDLGYWLPPTDFVSAYHVFVEVVFAMFTALFRSNANRRVSHTPALIVTERPPGSQGQRRPATYVGSSCHFGADACLGNVWSSLARVVATYGFAAGSSRGPDFASPSLLGARLGEDPAEDWIVGLRSPQEEAVRPPQLIRELHVGYPTMCEPLWGPDALFVDRASMLGLRQLANSPAVVACQRALWAFRRTLVLAAGVGKEDLPVTPAEPIRIFIASRAEDWARRVVNEADVASRIEQHVRATYPDRLPPGGGPVVQVMSVGGPAERQLRSVLTGATVFIGNHGANLNNLLYLRPNAGLITLDVMEIGFLPWPMAPHWLHWRRMQIEQACNTRLHGRKCFGRSGYKVMRQPNNNDNLVTDAQLEVLLRGLDEIIASQRLEPKVTPSY